jgi:hypothetical protein
MASLRAFLLRHRGGAALLAALAVLLKGLIPGGYMIVPEGGTLAVIICADASGTHMARHSALPGSGKMSGHSGKDGLCSYAGLTMAALAGGDAIFPGLGLAIGFILALGFAPVGPVRPGRIGHLRPPLRGPPASA